ncbi:MAG: rRNA pseudouridine synthase [Clostridiaceae bacterium]|jgi:16S rRNA pseudouridine516 synthase|nr:rRNA pseudouridine synthase [Clostridiaceae bacterium]
MGSMRLDRFLGEQGIATRSELKKIIKKGRVKVDGRICTDPGCHVDTETSRVTLDDVPVEYSRYVYLMMNKPGGVLTATTDRYGRTVLDLLTDKYRRMEVFPVGRLDKDTEGLLIITNNGSLAHNLLSPKKRVPKLYEAHLDRYPGELAIDAFKKGVVINSEFTALPAELRFISMEPVIAHVEIYEGKYHQVKRMFKAVGAEVTYLKRLRMGQLELDEKLKPGEYRELTEEEKGLIGTE